MSVFNRHHYRKAKLNMMFFYLSHLGFFGFSSLENKLGTPAANKKGGLMIRLRLPHAFMETNKKYCLSRAIYIENLCR